MNKPTKFKSNNKVYAIGALMIAYIKNNINSNNEALNLYKRNN